VPNIKELKDKILHEPHESAYSIHPGGNRMYHDLKATYWWYVMKRDVAEYVANINDLLDCYNPCKCLNGSGKRLPWTQSGYDSIWVIVDRLTKVAHFIPVKTTYLGPQLAELYMSRIVYLHGVPKKIVSDRGT
jgi:hypothetical protein